MKNCICPSARICPKFALGLKGFLSAHQPNPLQGGHGGAVIPKEKTPGNLMPISPKHSRRNACV